MLQRCRGRAILGVRRVSTYALSLQDDSESDRAELEALLVDKNAGCSSDAGSIARALQLCAKLGSLQQGRAIHQKIVEIGLDRNVFVGNHLINMYGKCSDADKARETFDAMAAKNVFSWTSMLGAYVEAGRFREAFELFWMMQLAGSRGDEVTFVSILNACTSRKQGDFVHSCIREAGFGSNPIVASAVANMYGKCGECERALEIFKGIHEEEKSVVCWTAMVAAFAQNGHLVRAFAQFRLMQLQGVRPNNHTLSTMLNACRSLDQVRSIHRLIRNVDDLVVGNALVSSYGKVGCLDEARAVFDQMPRRDLISWNAMLGGYASDEQSHDQALELYRLMQLDGQKSNKVAFITAVETSSSLEVGRLIHQCIVEAGMEANCMLGTTLVNMYSKFGSLDEGKRVFDKLPRVDFVAWNAMITAYAQNGHTQQALLHFRMMQLEGSKPVTSLTFTPILNACLGEEMQSEGIKLHEWICEAGYESDELVATALVFMLGRCGRLQQAQQMFERMKGKSKTAAWNAIIAVNSQQQNSQESLKLFKRMQLEGAKPDRVTFISCTNACWQAGAELEEMKMIEDAATGAGFEVDLMVMSSLVSMYGKSGKVEQAWEVFSRMPEHNTVSWNSMVAAYAQRGHMQPALKLVCKMQQDGFKADDITLTSALFACSHAGLLDQAQSYFVSLVNDYGMKPVSQHYSCMVDVLARAGQLSKLKDFVKSRPDSLDVVGWTSLLSACWNQSDVELAMIACDQILKLAPEQSSALVMLSNACSQKEMVIHESEASCFGYGGAG